MGKLDEEMSFDVKKMGIFLAVVAVMGLFLYFYSLDAQADFEKRMAKYNAMSVEEMAAYLAELNADPMTLDHVTEHTGTGVDGATMLLYRELSPSFLSEMVTDFHDVEGEKRRMSAQLKTEMCGYPTYDLFYDKGGKVKFIYHVLEDEHQKRFFFDVTIDKAACL